MIARVDNPEFIKLIEQGIPIERLERRMRPMPDWDRWWNDPDLNYVQQVVDEHDGWQDFSGVGFLGRDEKLLEVIISDLEAVESHGTTHPAIALALRNLLIGKHELNQDYVYLGGKKYQQFLSALGGLNSWTLNKILRESDSATDINLDDAFSFTRNERLHLDNGGEQSCPWNCYSASTPWSLWDEYVEAWKSNDSTLKRQQFIDYMRKSLASILRKDIFGSDEKVDQFIAERIEADENPDILYQGWNITEYKGKIEPMIMSLKHYIQSVNDDPLYPEENIRVKRQGNFYYNLYAGTMGIILRKEPFEDGKLEKLMSGYQSPGIIRYTQSPDVVESFDQLNQQVLGTMQKYLNRDGVIYVPVTGLLPHLIGKHYFFEGKETTHRADPAFLIQALNLEGIKS